MSRRAHICRHSMRKYPPPSGCHGASPAYLSIRNYVCLLFGLLCIFGPSVVETQFTCPSVCTCETWKVSGAKFKNISCIGQNFSEVPRDGKEGSDVLFLDLSRNNISSVAVADFQYFTSLLTLNLSYNPLTSFPSDVFSSLTTLQYLNLAGNDVQTLPSGIFDSSTLLYLNLSGNSQISFSKLNSDNHDLEILDISYMSIGTLPHDFFKEMKALKEVYMGYNNLTSTAADQFNKNDNLEIISFKGNELVQADKYILKHAKNCLVLDLSHNQISTVDDHFLRHGNALTNLDMSYNQISSLDKDLFDDARTLQTILLQNNQLTSIENTLFHSLPDLTKINLSSNRLTTLPSDPFKDLGVLEVDVSDNPFVCSCDVRDRLFEVRYRTDQSLLNEVNIFCTDSSGTKHLYLDWNDVSCSGNLGDSCTDITDCMARYSECSSGVCACSSFYYDNNLVTVAGGLCKPKVQLDYGCEIDDACQVSNAVCLPDTSAKSCQCMDGYYDTLQRYLGGECLPKVPLGSGCTSDIMCATNYSYCGMSNTCECQSSYYDNNTISTAAGECLVKHALNTACTASYQCATDNSECASGTCSCQSGYYDMANSGLCQDAAAFFACYPDNTTSAEVQFAQSTKTSTVTLCKEKCFQFNMKYYVHIDGICLCGTLLATTSSCCPVITPICNSRTVLSNTVSYVNAGMNLTTVPELTAGTPHSFSVKASLSIIDQIVWKFGDSDTVYNISSNSSVIQHTYTHSGQFMLELKACQQTSGTCDTVEVPIRVQVPPGNLTTWITGYNHADVATDMTDIFATFTQGYDFEYFWKKTVSGVVTKRQDCLPGWLLHRHICIQLITTPATFSTAATSCPDSGKLLQIDFMAEIAEIVTAFGGASSGRMILGGQRVGGMWQWASDGSRTVFSDSDLSSKTGDCLALEAGLTKLTAVSCSTVEKYACMTDPVDCPHGGVLLANGHCVVLHSSSSLPYNMAASRCSSEYNGHLASITDDTTHTTITRMMAAATVSSAWFGLSDQILDDYYLWADNTSYSFDGSGYTPTVTSNTESCFATSNTKTWESYDCNEVKKFVCQYSQNNERITVPSFVAGTRDVKITAGMGLQQVVSIDTFTATDTDTEIMLMPGNWFTRDGSIRSWILHSVDVSSNDSYDIALQVFRPSCPTSGTLVQPGCANTMFSTCASGSPSCTSTTSCSTGEQFCYLTNKCKPVNEPCTCVSESNPAACSTLGTASTNPSYSLVGQTHITIDSAGEKFYTIPAGDWSLREHDVVGVQYPAGKNVIKCEDIATSADRQTVYKAAHKGWLSKGGQFPSVKSVEGVTCYLQAIYTINNIKNLTQNLGYSSTIGSFDISISIVGSDTKTLSVLLEESIDDLVWIYPSISQISSVADNLGTVYTELNKTYDFTLRAGRGTNIQSVWSFDSSRTVVFESSCTASVTSVTGNLCNATLVWSTSPFAYFSQMMSSVGNSSLTITINNPLGAVMKTVGIRTEQKIDSVVLTLDTPSLIPYMVALNQVAQFSTSVAEGTGLSYEFLVDFVTVPSTNSTLDYTFTAVKTSTVQVKVTNIFGTVTSNVTVYVKPAANFTACHYVGIPYIAAVGVPFNVELECGVNIGAQVSAIWKFSDRSGNETSSTTETTSATNKWTHNATFTTAQTGLVITTITQDSFTQTTSSATVEVYNAVPTFTLTVSKNEIFKDTSIDFGVAVPLSPGNYGTVSYIYDFGDGLTVTRSLTNASHNYTTAGNFTATCRVSNGPSSSKVSQQILVYVAIAGLSMVYDGPNAKDTPTVFTASQTAGNFPRYRFVSSEFDVTRTFNNYTYTFTKAGDYNVTVTSSNGLSSKSYSMTAVILETSEIRINSLTMNGNPINGCFESGTANQFAVDVVHYDHGSLTYDWDFGDGSTQLGSTAASQSHTYAAGNVTLIVTVRYKSVGSSQSISQDICVQDRIVSPVLNLDSPIGLPVSGTITKTATITSTSGTSMEYAWTTNATAVNSPSSASFQVQFATEGFFEIGVLVSNKINSETVAKTVQVIKLINDLNISCASCIAKSGELYVRKDTSYDLVASVGHGSGVTFTWNFGDSSTGTSGSTATHTYTTIGTVTLQVTATNLVGSPQTASVPVHVEMALTSVDVRNYLYYWKDNLLGGLKILDISKEGKFEADVKPTGMVVEYLWEYETGLTPQISSSNIGIYNYTTTGLKTCTVTARNSLNNMTGLYQFYALERITSVNVSIGNILMSVGSPQIVAVNQTYNFTVQSTQIVSGAVRYTFIVKIGSKYHGNNVDETQSYYDYVFTGEMNYTLTVVLTTTLDPAGVQSTYNIESIYPVSGPAIVPVPTSDGNITLNSSITLEGSASQGRYLQYNWFYAVAPAGQVIPPGSAANPSVTLTPTAVGVYVVTLEVSNAVTKPAQTVNYTINVMIGVSGVAVGASLPFPDAIQQGSSSTFTGLVSAGTGLSYSWQALFGTVIDTGNAQNFTFTFTDQGVYNISLEISNYASVDTDYKEIYSLHVVPAFEISRNGTRFESTINKDVAQTGNGLDFSTNISSPDFLTYDWMINSTSVGSATVLHKTFTNDGLYVIEASVTNKISSKNKQLEVLVQDAIVNFDVSNCTGTFMREVFITLIASYSKGTDVNFIWNLIGSRTSTTSMAVEKFTSVGTYTINVTASNYVSEETKTCLLNIQGRISDLNMTTTLHQFAGHAITFNVSGNYLSLATFNWTFTDGTKNTTTVPYIDHIFGAAGQHTASVLVYNDVSKDSTSVSVNIEDLKCSDPVLQVDGPTNRTTLRARPIELAVSVSTSKCKDYTSRNQWHVYAVSSCSASLTNKIDLNSSIPTNMPSLLLPGATLSYGSFCVVFENSYVDTPVKKVQHFDVAIDKSHLRAILSGGDELVARAGTTLTLNASESSDPDQVDLTGMTYAWSCTHTMSSVTADAVCASISALTTSSTTLTGLTLTTGDIYTVTVTVSAAGRIDGTATQTIKVQSSSSPVVAIRCISCSANSNYNLSASGRVAVEGLCSQGCTPNTSYQWTVTRTSDGSLVTIDSLFTTTGTTSRNIVIKSGKLADGQGYTFKLEATENSVVGYAMFALPAGTVPSPGSCTITPSLTRVVPLLDKVTIKCQNWQETDSMSGIYYKIVAATTNDEFVLYYGTRPENSMYVSPWLGASLQDVDLKVYVLNDHGAAYHALTGTVKFEAPTLAVGQSDSVDYIIDQINDTMPSIANQNNPTLHVQYCIAVLNYLNNQSQYKVGSLQKRMAVRELIGYSLNGLPRTTAQDISQLASALKYLSMYPEELTTDTLTIVSNEIEVMTAELEAMVTQGLDQDKYQPDSLLDAITHLLEALLSQDSTVTNNATTTLFGSLDQYRLEISSTATSGTVYASAEKRKQAMIKKSVELNEQLMTVPLKTLLADEEEVTKTLSDGSVMIGLHVSVDNIKKSYTNAAQGVKIVVPQDVLAQTSYTNPSVFQIITCNTKNQLDFGYSTNLPLNTKTLTSSFLDTKGSSVSVQSLPEAKQIKMYMFSSNTSFYAINDSGLIDSTGYNPTDGVHYSTNYIQSGREYSFPIILPPETGASVTIQVRPQFVVAHAGASLEAKLYKNGVAYTATDANIYARPKSVTYTQMQNPQHDHRDYSFYIPPSDVGTDNAFKVHIQSLYVSVNVSIGNYFASCNYFDVSTLTWDNSGCVPSDEAIPNVIVCKCDHMTSYGGSLLVSPDQIDFTDLTSVDIISNPVAIITCGVILGLYLVAVIVCWRMDVADVKRISQTPLCGKDGSFKYEVTVVTGRQPGAGTSAHVGIRIIGEYGKSTRQHVSKAGAFQRTCSDTFYVAYDVNLGELKKVKIWHDNTGNSPSWYLCHVIINDLQTDKKYYFLCNSWLTLEEENGVIQKELKVAGAKDMQCFSYRIKTAMFNALADKHLWLSLFNRPAQSRFTRVQRATCCVTLLYTFIGVNAMWYGLLKSANSDLGWGSFGWEEIVLALVCNIMVVPFNVGIVFLFKKSRSKPTVFDDHNKPQTAQTLEIENLCGNSQGGSFESSNTGAVPYDDLERESTMDSVPAQAGGLGLRRSRHVTKTHRENTDDSLLNKRTSLAVTNASSMWNEDNIMNWPDNLPYGDGGDSRPSTSSTVDPGYRQQPPGPRGGGATPGNRKSKTVTKAESEELIQYLDKMESDLNESDLRQLKSSGSKRSTNSMRRPSMHKSNWGSLEDILHSDDESVADSHMHNKKKRGSTTSQSSKKFNPRADPRIHGHGSQWPKSRESIISSTDGVEPFTQSPGARITEGLRPGYYSEMTMESRDIRPIPIHKESCSLPPWCVYIAYVLCLLISVFAVVMVVLYCFTFGYDESVEWLVALVLSLLLSIILVETLKAVLIAVYIVATFKSVQQDEDEDSIEIKPSMDTSNEKIKDVKFKPISGFALMQAREEGRKIHRMKVIVRQFLAYVFYLWLLMVIVYVHFHYNSYLLNKHVENDFMHVTTPDYVSYKNITSIDRFWDWTENVLSESLHLQDSMADEEHGYLLGAARLRLIRSTSVKCGAAHAASKLGVESLTERMCYGDTSYEEDTSEYGERWNESSFNRSWKYNTASQLGGSHKIGHMGTYNGGGYTQVLGTSHLQTLTIIQDLKDKGWIDLRTRAVIGEFSLYSPGSDMTAMVALLIEFPLTGGVITSYEIQSQKLLWFQENKVDPLMVLECILLLVVIYSLVHIVNDIRENGKIFFKQFWNWYEMLTILMTIVAMGMYIGCVVEATGTFNNFIDDQAGFTNFERVAYVHVGMRYLHAWLLFLLMYKVVKQLRFIKFMYIYERTLSTAVAQLLGTGLIYIILLMVYAQLGYLMYGRVVAGFETFGHTLSTLIVMIRGTFDFWPMLEFQPIFSHFYVYSYYAFAYGLMVAFVISILTNTYRVTKSKMYYKDSLDMKDYEMIEFMLNRFKLWAGIQKPKPAFRRVRFQDMESLPSRSSSSYSNRTTSSLQSSQSISAADFSQVQLQSLMARIGPTWQAVLKRFEKIEALEKEEENLVKKAEEQMKDLNWKCRINKLEREHNEILNWKTNPTTGKPPVGDAKQRQSILKRLANHDNQERKAPASVSGAVSRTSATPPCRDDKVAQGRRPLSDQGARAEQTMSQRRSSTPEKSKIQKFFRSVKPSKPAWNK